MARLFKCLLEYLNTVATAFDTYRFRVLRVQEFDLWVQHAESLALFKPTVVIRINERYKKRVSHHIPASFLLPRPAKSGPTRTRQFQPPHSISKARYNPPLLDLCIVMLPLGRSRYGSDSTYIHSYARLVYRFQLLPSVSPDRTATSRRV